MVIEVDVGNNLRILMEKWIDQALKYRMVSDMNLLGKSFQTAFGLDITKICANIGIIEDAKDRGLMLKVETRCG